jgi:hypothetical protein
MLVLVLELNYTRKILNGHHKFTYQFGRKSEKNSGRRNSIAAPDVTSKLSPSVSVRHGHGWSQTERVSGERMPKP